MAMVKYNMEKELNNGLTFKDYYENNKSEFDNIKIIEENPCKDVQLVAEVGGRIFIVKNDDSYILTNGKNLVNNGFGEKENENFEDFECKEGIFSITSSNYKQIISTDFIEVDTNKKYYESIISKTNNVDAIYYMGISEYDTDKNIIHPWNYLYTENTLTYLEKELKNGDTEIYLNNLQNFNRKNIIKGINDGLIFWNYKDSKGYEYPELTYSRNVFFNLFDSENNFDLKENKIILKNPWNYGTIKKGVKLSQSVSAETFNYGVMNAKKMTNEYKCYENYIEGEKRANPKLTTKFRPATKYVKIVILINYNNLPDVTTDIKDIIFAEME